MTTMYQRERRAPNGLDRQGRYPEEAAHACTEVGAGEDHGSAPVGFAATVAWWLPVVVPLGAVPTVALIVAFWSELLALLAWVAL